MLIFLNAGTGLSITAFCKNIGTSWFFGSEAWDGKSIFYEMIVGIDGNNE